MQSLGFLLLGFILTFWVPAEAAPPVAKRTDDVTVLQAWPGEQFCRGTWCANPIDLAQCDQGDCSRVAGVLAGKGDRPIPSANVFSMGGNSVSCYALELRVLLLREAYQAPSFAGVGWSMSSATCGKIWGYPDLGRFIPKGELVQVGQEVTLKSGKTAIVLRFIALDYCAYGGDSMTLARHGKVFRPYARFDAEGVSNLNWDEVPTDYQTGCVSEDFSNLSNPFSYARSFDRQESLLRN